METDWRLRPNLQTNRNTLFMTVPKVRFQRSQVTGYRTRDHKPYTTDQVSFRQRWNLRDSSVDSFEVRYCTVLSNCRAIQTPYLHRLLTRDSKYYWGEIFTSSCSRYDFSYWLWTTRAWYNPHSLLFRFGGSHNCERTQVVLAKGKTYRVWVLCIALLEAEEGLRNQSFGRQEEGPSRGRRPV